MPSFKVVAISHSEGLGSGAERSLLETLNIFKDEIDFILIVPREGALKDEAIKLGIKVKVMTMYSFYEKKSYSRLKKLIKQAINIVALFSIYKEVKSYSPSCIYSNTITAAHGSIVGRILGIRNVWHIRELAPSDHIGQMVYGKYLEKLVLGFDTNRVVANSDFTKNFYQKRGVKCTVVANQPILIDFETLSSNKNDNSVLNVIYMGRIDPQKRIQDIINAISIICRENDKSPGFKPTVLNIFGSGADAYLAELMALVKKLNLSEQVKFHGQTEHPYREIAASDVLIMPAIGESFGRVIVESMKIGTNVVGAAAGNTPYLIENNTTGLLYRPGEAHELANAIMKISRESDFAESLRANAKAYAAKKFSEKSYADTLRGIFVEDLRNSV